MKLCDAVATKKPFRRLKPQGRWIKHVESCNLVFFKFSEPLIKGQAKEDVTFAPADFEAEWEIEPEKAKDPTPIERAVMACEILKQAIRELGEAKPG